MGHPGIVSVPAPDCANQQNSSTEVVIDFVQSFLYGAYEGRAVEKREDNVEVIEVTLHKVSHEVHLGVLKVYGRGDKYRGHPLEGS